MHTNHTVMCYAFSACILDTDVLLAKGKAYATAQRGGAR